VTITLHFPRCPLSPSPSLPRRTVTHLLLGEKALLPGGDLLPPPAMLKILPETTKENQERDSKWTHDF